MILTQCHPPQPISTLNTTTSSDRHPRFTNLMRVSAKLLQHSGTTVMQNLGPHRRRRATSLLAANHHDIRGRMPTRTPSGGHQEPMVLDADMTDDSAVSVSPARTSESLDATDDPDAEHVIRLSSVEHCMPRAYIRVCLAYHLPADKDLDDVLSNLRTFIRNTVNAKPYLSGYVLPVDKNRSAGPVEIRFSNDDFLNYPDIEVRRLCGDDGKLLDYADLDAQGFPPSKLHPDKVAVLPAVKADEKRAPVFRAQANLVRGGLIVSFYLHHCISDGTGLGLLVTGAVQDDDFAFKRHLEHQNNKTPSVGERLAAFANRKSIERSGLSWSDHNQTPDRPLLFKRLGHANGIATANKPGRGCVISIPDSAIYHLRKVLSSYAPGTSLTRHNVLQAFIWRHMTRARLPVVALSPAITESKLLIPVNIRNRLKQPLSEFYFGAAVDFAMAKFDICALVEGDMATLAAAARAIRQAVDSVDEPYIRQAIALARSADPTVDVRDLLASNMNRVTGADMYITSWEKLQLYDADLNMGLGTPAWVRKPWSRDPGSCIILPRNSQKDQFEVVVQMTEDDMSRLLMDSEFMKYVSRVID